MSRLLLQRAPKTQYSPLTRLHRTSTATRSIMTLFSDVPLGPPDPMYDLKKASDEDRSPAKIDVGVGVYRSEKGGYHEFDAIRKAKKILESQNLGHEYNPTTGIQPFIDGATRLLFGKDSALVRAGRIASVQTVAGTGANRLGAVFLNRNFPSHSARARSPSETKVYIGTPAWGNYAPLFQHAGFAIETYVHYDRKAGKINFAAAIETVINAPEHSIFVFQVCCHNPTGHDFSQEQWRQLADEFEKRQHFVFFDIAYQGFASDMETDRWCIDHFATRGIDVLACQSFSKHMGLYSERVGVLHVVCQNQQTASRVGDQLRSLIRWEVSSTPAYGARLAANVMEDESLCIQWLQEVATARERLQQMRLSLYQILVQHYNTPGDWQHIVQEKGLFSMLALSETQISQLRTQHHIHLPSNGRINVAGLNEGNLGRFAAAIDLVVRAESQSTKWPEPDSSEPARQSHNHQRSLSAAKL